MAEYTSPCGGRLGVVTDTTGVARGCEACELLIRWALWGEREVSLRGTCAGWAFTKHIPLRSARSRL